MNPSRSKDTSNDDGPSSGNSTTQEVTSSESTNKDRPEFNLTIEEDGMKRAAVKELIHRYFYQLTDGCGNKDCDNDNCFSSGKFPKLTPNDAAGKAIKLWNAKGKLCDQHPAKIPRTTSKTTIPTTDENNSTIKLEDNVKEKNDKKSELNKKSYDLAVDNDKCPKLIIDIPDLEEPVSEKTTILTEKIIYNLIEECKKDDCNYTRLRSLLYEVFTNQDYLSESFKRPTSVEQLLEYIPECITDKMTKEEMEQYVSSSSVNKKNKKNLDITSFQNCKPITAASSSGSSPSPLISSDEESSTASVDFNIDTKDDSTEIDMVSLRRAYDYIYHIPSSQFESTLIGALVSMSECIDLSLRCGSSLLNDKLESIINIFIIIFENPNLGGCDYVEKLLPKVCKAISQLPMSAKARITRIWSKHCKDKLYNILEALHQLITIKTISCHFHKDFMIQDDESITAPTVVMKLIYYANILAGDLEPTSFLQEEKFTSEQQQQFSNDDPVFGVAMSSSSKLNNKNSQYKDPLGEILEISTLDSRKPLIPFKDFYNEPLSEAIEMDRDFGNYKASEHFATSAYPTGCSTSNGGKFSSKFSFMHYSFILTPATKTLGLYYDNRIRMYSERRMSYLHTVIGQPTNPYLRLKVRRDHIIEDALVELEMIAMENDKDLKKQLVVEFEGEQGIDEGGVSKEFFQLVVEEIFNPDFGMFCHNEETHHMWFNAMSFESDAQFILIGIVLGLAIYNNVILDVHFPMVVYKKLMGKCGTFYDLEDFNPVLFNGLKELLEYEGDDIANVFLQTFRICYTDPFGTVLYHDLKPDGDNIKVVQENKKEFVELYANYLLNTSIEKQFIAFRRGFQMVTDEAPLNILFRPEEIEQLVCGSKTFNLSELEEATEYDAGYSSDTPIIKYFWEIVHSMPSESQRKLLQFTTGSDRIPVGGLSKLKMIIARSGPDSDRLPTAHTCFNVLLLPEYSSKEKLLDRLTKAINYSKGFGML